VTREAAIMRFAKPMLEADSVRVRVEQRAAQWNAVKPPPEKRSAAP